MSQTISTSIELEPLAPAPAENASATHIRCHYRFPGSGRQCRLLAANPSKLCQQHLEKKKSLQKNADFSKKLMNSSHGFQTAQGINHSLGKLYEIFARDRISVRRATALANISSLLLRTLPAIDHDKALGICTHEPGACPGDSPKSDPAVAVDPPHQPAQSLHKN
jgi:hypothetical protein